MKRAKKWLSFSMAALMLAGLLAACGGKADTGAEPPADQTAGEAPTSQTDTDADTGESGANAEREPYTVKIMMFDEGKTDYVNEVAAAASEITEAKFNTTIELVRIGWGSWSQQVMLALTSGEKLDIFPAFALETSFPSLVSNGQLLPMDEYLTTVGADTYAAISAEDWGTTTIGGQVYGVPMNKGKQNVYGAACNADIAEELGIDLDAIKNLDDFEDALRIIKEAYPDMYPMATNNGKLRVMVPSDQLGDGREIVLGALVNVFDGTTTVENLYASDEYREFVERMYRWAQLGYIMPDGASNTESGTSLIRAGVSFADFYTGPAPDTEARISTETGVTIKDVVFFDYYKTTTETQPCWSIAANSENPERAMEILNEMYTNQELANLFIYGLEGRTYEFVNDERTVIDYPAGVDAGNSDYAFDHWGWPNMQLSYVWNGYPEDVYDQYAVFNETVYTSPAYGFTFDNSAVINEYTACTNVVLKYVEALNCGALDPAENLDKFNQELEENGINAIIAEKQRQLDEWLAAQ